MAKHKNLSKAKSNKNDEFYTQLSDIERELRYYRPYFKGKTVLCNCDDPFESNFFMYFVLNFNTLGLKKLICTCYAGSPVAGTKLQYHVEDNGQMSFVYDADGKLTGSEKHAYKAVINVLHDATGNGGIEMVDVAELFKTGENELTELEGDGDFRSPECINLLKEADIVCTNPPFSLFREYVAQLMKYKKQFLIIGNQNAITYKEIFPLLKDNKMWMGYGFANGNAYFSISSEKAGSYTKGVYDKDTGLVKFRNCCWFTNFDIKKRHEDLICCLKYNPEDYPKYDNYDAINVDKTAKIPYDYTGIMGVPISFMDKHDPEQFEIIGLGNSRENFSPNKDYVNPKKHLKNGIVTNGGAINCVLAVNQKEVPKGQVYYTSDNSDYLVPPYARILIRYTDSWIASHPDNFKNAS